MLHDVLQLFKFCVSLFKTAAASPSRAKPNDQLAPKPALEAACTQESERIKKLSSFHWITHWNEKPQYSLTYPIKWKIYPCWGNSFLWSICLFSWIVCKALFTICVDTFCQVGCPILDWTSYKDEAEIAISENLYLSAAKIAAPQYPSLVCHQVIIVSVRNMIIN